MVWDTYIADSLKESTREKRGHGIRRKVSPQAKLPGKWMDFLRDSRNKEELFQLLTCKVADFACPPEKVLYITARQDVLSKNSNSSIPSCNHEEADTRIVVHLMHALQNGARTVQVRTVDTDVVAILVGKFRDFTEVQPLANIWVAFGTGKNFCFHHINSICVSLGELRSQSLPVFHAFSGCDTTSSFLGKGISGQPGRPGMLTRR